MCFIASLYDEGIKLFKEGDYEKSAQKFVKLVDFDKTNAKAWNALGICLIKLEDFSQARTCFINAMKFDPDNQSYLKNLKIATGKTEKKTIVEPKGSLLKRIKRKLSKFHIGATEYACLCIGLLLVAIYFFLPETGVGIQKSTLQIIGLCGVIFVFFFIITSLMKYLQFLGVKRIHFIITLIAILIVAYPIFYLMNIPVSDQFFSPNITDTNWTNTSMLTPIVTKAVTPVITYSPENNPSSGLPVREETPCPKLKASFTYLVMSMDPYTVQFIDTSDTLISPSYPVWNFGDNTNSTDKKPVHEYGPSPKPYSINLTVTNDCGDTDTLIRTIHPTYANITPVMAVTPDKGNCPFTITCVDHSYPVSDIKSWRWTFGDGDTYETTDPNRRNTTHTYMKSGTYYATLAVKNRYNQHYTQTSRIIAMSYGTISGNLWSDENSNGMPESGEKNLTGWGVVLDKKQDAGWIPTFTTTTGNNGMYHFTITDTGGIYRVRVIYPQSKTFEITNGDNNILPNVSQSLPIFESGTHYTHNVGVHEINPGKYHEVSLISTRKGYISGGKMRWHEAGNDGIVIINGTTYTTRDGDIGEITFTGPSQSSQISITGGIQGVNLTPVTFSLNRELQESGNCSYLNSSSISGFYSTLMLHLESEPESDISLVWDGKEIPVNWRNNLTITGLNPMENQKMELEVRSNQVYFSGRAESYEIL